jgi:hypothetical protein
VTPGRRLATTRALLDQPPTPVPGQLTLDQAREAVPDGKFGGAQPVPENIPRPPLQPWTPQQQYEHRQALLEALDGWDWHDTYADTRRTRERQRYHRRTPAA